MLSTSDRSWDKGARPVSPEITSIARQILNLRGLVLNCGTMCGSSTCTIVIQKPNSNMSKSVRRAAVGNGRHEPVIVALERAVSYEPFDGPL